MKKIHAFLFEEVDNSSLVMFRVFFGLLLALETGGAIATGWVHNTFIEPEFTFTFIGLEFLQPLPGNWMYVYFSFMALLGIGVMLGYRYKWCLGAYTLLWTMSYLMQKSHYNNHYYLLVLLCLMMLITPAHRYLSMDVKRNPKISSLTCPRWCYVFFMFQLWIVYTWAGIVKFYPGWLNGDFVSNLFASRAHFFLIGPLLQNELLQQMLIYGGIFFDLFIIYLLLWKRTRMLALFLSFFFHMFNSWVLHIGIFPYLMLAMDLFFFPPEKVRSTFLKKKPKVSPIPINAPISRGKEFFTYAMALYFLIQILLPIRPYLFKGNVFWTEEGHRLSWRMMLRTKRGNVKYKIIRENGEQIMINPRKTLAAYQANSMASKPDMIWQYAQRLKKEYLKKGEVIQVYAIAYASLNGSSYKQFIDPEVDLAAEPWKRFQHKEWILSHPFENE